MQAKPIWHGTISFGLVAIPVNLFAAENIFRASFHLLDKRNNARIHYERINEITGKSVPWTDIVKAFEFEKDNFVVVDDKQIEKTNNQEFKTINISEFIEKSTIEFPYLDKPYYLSPTKGGEKGYDLLMETLSKSKKAAIATIVIRTKQYIAVIAPYQNILLLNLLRYYNELKKPQDVYKTKTTTKNKVSAAEIKMAEQLIESMTTKWDPKKYHNKSNEILKKVITQKIKKGKSIIASHAEKKPKPAKGQVLDFMELLKKSVKEKNKRKVTKK